MAVEKLARLAGVKEAKAAFKGLPESVRRIYMADVVAPTAEAVAGGARRRVRRRSGVLADAIAVSKSKTGWARVYIKKLTRVFQLPGGYVQKVNARSHSHLIEFGTSHGRPALPFMRPALEAEAAPFASRGKAAGPAIESEFSRAAGRAGG